MTDSNATTVLKRAAFVLHDLGEYTDSSCSCIDHRDVPSGIANQLETTPSHEQRVTNQINITHENIVDDIVFVHARARKDRQEFSMCVCV